MIKIDKKFKKVVILDTVIFYPEHRKLLNAIAEEVLEYPTSLPENLEKQYEQNPDIFLNKKCYTHIAINDTSKQLLMNRVDGADVIISCWTDIPDEIIRLNPQLKLIIFWTHEKEHRINMELAEELGITVSNIPDYGTDAVAEVVFAGLFELIQRNFKTDKISNNSISNAITNCVFNHFRLLRDNEKNTRSGRFTHHFHKIGEAKFDFNIKKINELIPERLVEYKRVGLLNIINYQDAVKSLEALRVICSIYNARDNSVAEYYKFLAQNDLIIYDSSRLGVEEVKRISIMFGYKLVDIKSLSFSDYSYSEKTFGIVGLGRIGKKVAKIAVELGFKVVYYSKTRNKELEKQIGIDFISLEKLAEVSDVISIHLPAHKAENLFSDKLIRKIKNGLIFINTADGNAVDQKALTQRMLNEEIYAFLDVYPGLPRKDVLGMEMKEKKDWKIQKELPKSVISYRSGWKTQESIAVKTYKLIGEMLSFLIENKDNYVLK